MIHTAWLVPAFPLAGFALLLVTGRRPSNPAAGVVATLAMLGSFAAAVVTFAGLVSRAAPDRAFTQHLWNWVPVAGFRADASLLVDPLSVTMALFVTGVGALIHLYSIGYMRADARYGHFFIYLNLFAFSMLTLVMADNFVLMFLGWEGVGLCSYLLISFWFERETAAVAGKKAFVTNRVGDFGLMVAMFLVFAHFGSFAYRDVFGAIGARGIAEPTANAIGLLALLGACGKSAQLPLYVWLPDAMEGPTPVSALIHAATMVTAGVYLTARLSPIFLHAPAARTAIAVVGAATALLAATIACAEDDIKRVLAYSTISQLGYMFLAVGSGLYVAGVFHMVTHAFFKALLFLAAGAVIHGLHDRQDMKEMGSLRRFMPLTAATFAVGWLAISGIPPFAGFWSKDDILLGAWQYNRALWAVGFLTAGLTAYYMSRQVALVFLGRARWSTAPPRGGALHAGAPHAKEPHDAPAVMALPLVVLAIGSAAGGLLDLPWGRANFLERFLDPVLGPASTRLALSTGTKVGLAVATSLLCLLAIAAGLRVWAAAAEHPALEPALLRRGWFVDSTYAAVMGGPGQALAALSAYGLDARVVDGAVNGVGTLVRVGASRLRQLQTGYVRNYALAVAAGAVAVLAYVAVRAA